MQKPLAQPPTPFPVPPAHPSASIPARVLEFVAGLCQLSIQPLLWLLVLVAPLAVEGATPATAFGCEVLIGALVACWLSSRLAAPVPAPVSLGLLKYAFWVWGAIALVQLVPLPPGLVQSLSPAQALIAKGLYPLLPATQVPLDMTLTLAPEKTWRGLLRLLLAVGLFLAVRDSLRKREDRRTLVHTLLIAGLLQVGIGVMQYLLNAEGILFIPGLRVGDFPFFGTFLNPNRNAAYLNLLWPLAASLVLESFVGRSEEHRNRSGVRRPGHGWQPWTVYLLAALALMVGVVMCRSRAAWGIISLLGVTLGALGFARAGKERTGLLFWLGTVLLGLGALFVFWQPLLAWITALAEKPDEVPRPLLWKLTWQIAHDHLWTGVGLGAFEEAFGSYNSNRGLLAAAYPENTYLEILVELGLGGVIGALLLALSAGRLVWRHQAWSPRYGRRAVPGILAGLLGLTVHGLSEQAVGGYGLLVTVVVMGALLMSTLEDSGYTFFEPHFRYGAPPARMIVPLLVLPGLVAGSGSLHLGRFAASRAQDAFLGNKLMAVEPLLQKARTYAPLSGLPSQWLGTSRLQQVQELTTGMGLTPEEIQDVLAQISEDDEAQGYLEEAVRKLPFDSTPQRLMGRLAFLRGERDKALAYSELAHRVQPSDYRNWLQLGRQYLATGKQREGYDALQQAMLLAPQNSADDLVNQLLPIVVKLPKSSEALRANPVPWWVAHGLGVALDERGLYRVASPWLTVALNTPAPTYDVSQQIAALAVKREDAALVEAAASHLRQYFPETDLADGYLAEARRMQGRLDEAIALLESAAPRSKQPNLLYLRAAQLLLNANRGAEAERILLRLLELSPYNAQVYLTLARLYAASPDNRTRATELLRQAARLAPANEEPLYQLWLLHKDMGMTMVANQDMAACLKLARAPLCSAAAGREAMTYGEYGMAVQLLTRALELSPGSLEVQKWLEEARAKASRGDEASAPSGGEGPRESGADGSGNPLPSTP